ILRGVVSDFTSPLTYGYESAKNLPVYFNQDPVLSAGGGAAFGGFGGRGGAPNVGQNTTPMAGRQRLSPWDWDGAPPADAPARGAQPGDAQGGGRGAFPGGFGFPTADGPRPRDVLQFPANAAD